MAREASITQEQVQVAVAAIRAEGRRPTLRAVRDRLGAGSMATVAKLVQQVAEAQSSGDRQPSIPPALQRALLDFLTAEATAAREPLEMEIAEQRQAVLDLAAEVERLVATIDSQALDVAALSAAKASAEGRADQLLSDMAEARAEAARERHAAEEIRTELAKAMLRLESLAPLQAERDALRQELATERQARVEAEKHAAVLEALAKQSK